MAITTTSSLPAPVQQHFAMTMLAVKVPNMIHNVCAMKGKMPRNSGTTVRYRRPNLLNPSTVPLGNSGVLPPGQTLTAVDIDAKISFYGTYININEQVTLQNQDPVLNWGTQQLGIALRKSEDILTRDMLAASAGFINCVGGVNGDIPTEITQADVNNVVTTLYNNDAHTIMDNIEGADMFGTAPIRRAFFVMASTNLTKNLNATPGFVHTSKYTSQNNVLTSEYGSIDAMRFLVSSQGSVSLNASSTGANVYNCFVTGMQSYAVIQQDGYSSQYIYRPAIYSDQLAQNFSIAYKFAQAQRILNDQWIINMRCTLA